jgi:hypothetical protein
MRLVGTRIREVRESLAGPPVPEAPRVTPPGVAIASVIHSVVIAGVAGGSTWILGKGVEVWLRWLGLSEAVSYWASGFVWGIATGLLIDWVHRSVRRHISLTDHLAPHFGHRLYETYRALRSSSSVK